MRGLLENLTACNAPVRHVSFEETGEVVEFNPAVPASLDAEVQPAPVAEHDAQAPDVTCVAHARVVEYDVPAPNMAYLVHSALAPVVEFDAPALNVACQAHAAPAPVVEYAPAPTVTYREHAASAPEFTPAPDVTYLAHAAAATVVTPAPTMAYRVSGELVEDLFTAMMDKFIKKLDEQYERG